MNRLQTMLAGGRAFRACSVRRPVRRPVRAVAGCEGGATIVEFALVVPVFLILFMGCLNMAHIIYGQAVLNGAVSDVARSATLETTDTVAADAEVKRLVETVLPGAIVIGTRKSYYDFTDIARPEKWNDKNGDGTCNTGESYTDENRNGSWDRDIGKSGNGGANDVVLYSVTASFRPLMPIPVIIPDGERITLKSVTVRKNQPFGLQQKYSSVAATC